MLLGHAITPAIIALAISLFPPPSWPIPDPALGTQPSAPTVPAPAAPPTATPAGQSDPALPILIRSESLMELTDEANREFRLLMVYSLKKGESDWLAKMLAQSETLSEFVRDHCLLARVVASEHPDEYFKVIVPLTAKTKPKGASPEEWEKAQKVFIFKRDKFSRVVPNTLMAGKWGGREMLAKVNLPEMKPIELESKILLHTRPLEILFEASFLLDKLATQDQTWLANHKKFAAARGGITHTAACEFDDGLAPPVREPARADDTPGKPWRVDAFFNRLAEVKRLIQAGSIHDATGPCCWLWERWRSGPPELRPAVLFFVTEQARQLSELNPSSRERFVQARELALAWRHTGDFSDRLSWYALNESLGDFHAVVGVFDLALHDPDEGSMITPGEAAAYEIMLGRNWSHPWHHDAPAVAWWKKLGTQLDTKRPVARRSAGGDDTTWEMFEEFRRQTWIAEGCRLYVAALKAGDMTLAGETSKQLFARDEDGNIRRALVATAVAADVARPEHRDWLLDSEGGLTLPIRAALDDALDEQAGAKAGRVPQPAHR